MSDRNTNKFIENLRSKKISVPSCSTAARDSEEDANDNRILFTSQGRHGARIVADPAGRVV